MKIINLLNRVIGNHGRRLKKADEYMYWSPFTSHHKPKLQINVKTGKWHCWVSNQGGHNLFQLFKKLKANREQFTELGELVGSPKSLSLSSNRDKVKDKILRLPNEFKPMWSNGGGIIQKHSWVYLQNRGITKGDIEKGDTSEFSLLGTKQGKSKNLEVVFKKVLGKKVGGLKKGRMFTAAEVRALDEAKSAKNYKKKDRIKSSGDKERIELMGTNLKKFTDGGMCRGAGAAIKGTKFKGVF